jgi:hypothetical protein
VWVHDKKSGKMKMIDRNGIKVGSDGSWWTTKDWRVSEFRVCCCHYTEVGRNSILSQTEDTQSHLWFDRSTNHKNNVDGHWQCACLNSR